MISKLCQVSNPLDSFDLLTFCEEICDFASEHVHAPKLREKLKLTRDTLISHTGAVSVAAAASQVSEYFDIIIC